MYKGRDGNDSDQGLMTKGYVVVIQVAQSFLWTFKNILELESEDGWANL